MWETRLEAAKPLISTWWMELGLFSPSFCCHSVELAGDTLASTCLQRFWLDVLSAVCAGKVDNGAGQTGAEKAV